MAMKVRCDTCGEESDWSKGYQYVHPNKWRNIPFGGKSITLCPTCVDRLGLRQDYAEGAADSLIDLLKDLIEEVADERGEPYA